MSHSHPLHGSLLPLLLLATGTGTQCRLSTESDTGELRISGIVHLLRVEQGCWQLQAVNGRRYELLPDQAPGNILRDGAVVTLVGQPTEGSATGCQVGMPIAVRRVVSLS